ncbi:MAG: quinolinate synthase [Chloroflexi bacterium]|nr:quinolinate synthase [Chloroflexota bacterium]
MPVVPITELEQSAFCQTEEDLESKSLIEEFAVGVKWQRIPKKYLGLSPKLLAGRIQSAKKLLGQKVVILGHHYQRDEVIQFADYTGDSFKLSEYAASQTDAEHIIFCGVHFMAETADILTDNSQNVILPNMTAGCSMADMAITDDVLDCWDDLNSVLKRQIVTPITYMNSTADIKSLCGENDGVVCTSSNAKKTFEWALKKQGKILFLPDQHLGRNTASRMGVSNDEMIVWDPFKPLGGNSEEDINKSKIILWKGHCSVHTRFTLKQINSARDKHNDVKVIVHPECTPDVVDNADLYGSTEFIINEVVNAKPGSTWAIGTEINLVKRLAKENQDKNIFCLDSIVCPCATMYRIHPAYLLWMLENLVENNPTNVVKVASKTKENARKALDLMLSLS